MVDIKRGGRAVQPRKYLPRQPFNHYSVSKIPPTRHKKVIGVKEPVIYIPESIQTSGTFVCYKVKHKIRQRKDIG